jgi:hypothetical protein
MATNNAVNTSLSGQTGTGNFVGANTPTLITPVLGVATGTSINFGSSSTLGLIGVSGGSDAASTYVGEVISSVLLVGSNVSLTSLVVANITSISLTAGDWDVWAELWGNAASTTTITSFSGAINTDSTTFPSVPAIGTSVSILQGNGLSRATIGQQFVIPIAEARISISGTTIYYLNATAGFGVSTLAAYGKLVARRRR